MKLQQITTKRHKFIPCKNTTAQERLAAMQGNDMMNVKARHETTFNAKLDDIIYADEKHYYLEDYILDAKYNDQLLFLAAEPGSGGYGNNLQVVLNPSMKCKAREWLVEVCPTILFTFANDNKTSVNAEEFRNACECDESLKEFLSPILNQKEAKRMKKHGKKNENTCTSFKTKCRRKSSI